MKTSNKILLGTFLTSILILITVHTALYAKFKRGDYTVVSDEWMPNLATFSLENIKYVALENIENVNLQVADSSKLLYDKPREDEENILTFSKQNDTLFVVGKSKRNNIGRWYRNTKLYVTSDIIVKATNTNVRLDNDRKRDAIGSLKVFLDNALIDIHADDPKTVAFDSVSINGFNKSRIMLYDVRMNGLNLSLSDTYLEGTKLEADKIAIISDSASEIKLSARNLLKAKLTAHE